MHADTVVRSVRATTAATRYGIPDDLYAPCRRASTNLRLPNRSRSALMRGFQSKIDIEIAVYREFATRCGLHSTLDRTLEPVPLEDRDHDRDDEDEPAENPCPSGDRADRVCEVRRCHHKSNVSSVVGFRTTRGRFDLLRHARPTPNMSAMQARTTGRTTAGSADRQRFQALAPAQETASDGQTDVRDSGLYEVPVPSGQQHAVQALPQETLVYLLGSRYCDTDKLSEIAWALFSGTPMGWARVQAIRDFVHDVRCLRNNEPRIGRILIARGRDAADVAISTTFGENKLESFRVWTNALA